MRIVELSDHPGEMLQDIQLRRNADEERARAKYQEALARHESALADARRRRDQARAQRRWLTWLLKVFSVWSAKNGSPVPPVTSSASTDREEILVAGIQGEDQVAAELAGALSDEWVLLRGYRNNRGEIDHILLGPQGLIAIEVKNRNATVYINGDNWEFEKYDNYGNLVDEGRITDRRGRSPSQQLNQPADELERFLHSRRQQVSIRRVVILTHLKSDLGGYEDLTVDVATSTDYVLSLLDESPPVFESGQLVQIEQLIERDHQHHQARRPVR